MSRPERPHHSSYRVLRCVNLVLNGPKGADFTCPSVAYIVYRAPPIPLVVLIKGAVIMKSWAAHEIASASGVLYGLTDPTLCQHY
eukprot:53850-Eustigmatos_ZCMA.PRE.1